MLLIYGQNKLCIYPLPAVYIGTSALLVNHAQISLLSYAVCIYTLKCRIISGSGAPLSLHKIGSLCEQMYLFVSIVVLLMKRQNWRNWWFYINHCCKTVQADIHVHISLRIFTCVCIYIHIYILFLRRISISISDLWLDQEDSIQYGLVGMGLALYFYYSDRAFRMTGE